MSATTESERVSVPAEDVPSAVEALRRDLSEIPERLARSTYAVIALRQAARLDDPKLSADGAAKTTRNLIDALDRLYAMVPKKTEEDALEVIRGGRDERLASDRSSVSAA